MSNRDKWLEQTIVNYVERVFSRYRNLPIFLGGAAGANGGVGGPPNDAIGTLPQTFISYDTTEAATSATSATPTLVDNLNHIRAQHQLNADESIIRAWWGWGG